MQRIDRLARVVDRRGWKKQVTLRQGRGYTLGELFPPSGILGEEDRVELPE